MALSPTMRNEKRTYFSPLCGELRRDTPVRKFAGIHVPHHKNTTDMAPEALPVPKTVTLPMSMHSGAPANIVVAPGDFVKLGQIVGEAVGAVSAPVHASVSGKVREITEIMLSSGRKSAAVVLESDGLQEPTPDLVPHPVESMEQFIAAIRDSGAVGLGGAGYPTAAKFAVKEPARVEVILINGAECEPYVTTDARAMVDDAELLIEGARTLRRFFTNCKVLIGIEENKPQAISELTRRCAQEDSVEVRKLPSLYPQGSKNALLYSLTGKIVPEGGRLTDAGALIVNCATLVTVMRYIKTGMPFVSRCITVDGPAVISPKNVIVPLGTAISEVLDFCRVPPKRIRKLVVGGPMMGVAIPDADMPIIKYNNGILAFREVDVTAARTTACIRCGRCMRACPMNLMPLQFESAFLLKKPEELGRLKVNMCIECGSCAYSCPAARPLVQEIRLGKTMLRNFQAKNEGSGVKK